MFRRSFFIPLMCLMLALVGCSNGDGEAKNQKQDSLVIGLGGDAVSLDPAEVTDSVSENVSQSILETLVTFAEGETEVEPLLAKEWTKSDDGLTYTFTLEEGVQFHDDTAFNAEAVVYNFEHWMNADEDKYFMYGSVFGGYKGDENHAIESVKAVEAHTVEFKLKYPKPTFLKDLALTPFSISSPEAIEEHGENYGSNPVGTGPFTFEEWKRKNRVVLNKNEEYWVDGYPKVNQVVFRVIPDNSNRLNALKSGEIHLMDGLSPENIEEIDNDENFKVFSRPSLNIGYLGFNVEREPFDDKLVRQALNHAVDKEAIIKAFFAGQAEPAKNPIPPVVQGYNDDIEEYEYDPEKAKELLEKAGHPDGFKMELWAMPVARPYMPDANKVAESIQSDLAKVGVEAEIVSYEWATYLDKVKDGEADSFILGWTGTNGDADDFIYNLWHEDNIGSLNSTRYAIDEVNSMLNEARKTTDQEKRNELYGRVQEIMHDDPPIVPLVHATPALAGRADLKGFDPHPTGRIITTKISFE